MVITLRQLVAVFRGVRYPSCLSLGRLARRERIQELLAVLAFEGGLFGWPVLVDRQTVDQFVWRMGGDLALGELVLLPFAKVPSACLGARLSADGETRDKAE